MDRLELKSNNERNLSQLCSNEKQGLSELQNNKSTASIDRNNLKSHSENDQLVDPFGRRVTHLRVSITNQCNLECPYCHQEGHINQNEILSREKIVKIIQACSARGVKTVKLTGGEPLLRKDIIELVGDISATPGIKEVSLTTNGILLDKLAYPLKKAGLTRLNIGCDSLTSSLLAKNEKSIAKGLEAAKQAGLTPIKLNMVVLKGLNELEIDQMIQFAQKHGVILQLIELIETGSKFVTDHFIDLEAVEQGLAARAWKVKTRRMQARKQYYIDDGIVEVVRSLHNQNFCRHCNKLRVTNDGYFKPCLMREDNLVSIDEFDVDLGLISAVEQRRPYYG